MYVYLILINNSPIFLKKISMFSHIQNKKNMFERGLGKPTTFKYYFLTLFFKLIIVIFNE